MQKGEGTAHSLGLYRVICMFVMHRKCSMGPKYCIFMAKDVNACQN